MKREAKVGDRIKFTRIFGGAYKGEVKAIDGDEAWVLFDGNTNHTSIYLNELKVVLPPPKFKKGDRVRDCGCLGKVITSHINAQEVRWIWVEFDNGNCYGCQEENLLPCP